MMPPSRESVVAEVARLQVTARCLNSGEFSYRAARRGLSVLEVTLSLLILAVAIGGLAQLLTTAAAQRRTSETRRLASQEVANVAERISLLAWDDVTAERLVMWKPAEDLTAAVPSATLQIAVESEPGPPAAKRVQIGVQWTDASGQTLDPVSLTVWKFPMEEAP